MSDDVTIEKAVNPLQPLTDLIAPQITEAPRYGSLYPFVLRYRQFWRAVLRDVDGMTDARALVAMCASLTATNCAWDAYQVGDLIQLIAPVQRKEPK